MITLKQIQKNESIQALVHAGNRYLAAMGYTDHGPRHVGYVSKTASDLLRELGYSEREIELAAIAGWVHDVGNSVNRHEHGPNGAVLLYPILREAGMEIADVVEIITAVGNHEEQSGFISSPVSAALAIADKSDAHKSRVRGGKPDPTDPHDRVNFAIQQNRVIVDTQRKVIRQEIRMDDSSSVLEFLSIYMARITMCEQAAAFLGCHFELPLEGKLSPKVTDEVLTQASRDTLRVTVVLAYAPTTKANSCCHENGRKPGCRGSAPAKEVFLS